VRAVLDLPLARSDHRLLAVLGLADPQDHGPMIEDGLRRLVRRPAAESALGFVTSPYLVSADRNLAALQAAELDRLRRDGLLRMIPLLSATYGWTELCLARWSNATVAADEGLRVAEELGQPIWAAGNMIAQAMLATVGGDHDTAAGLADRAEGILLPLGVGASLCGIQLTRTVGALAAGRYEEAYATGKRVFDVTDAAHHRVQAGWLLGDLATAALYCGSRDEARDILARYDRPGGAPSSPWTMMAIEFARPLLADDDAAEDLFTAALRGPVAGWPAYRARLLLEYGTWMRRQRRVAESRHPLRAAREACDALGLRPWSERARAELRASGEGSGPGPTPMWTRLSAQELQIAKLASAGLSNREIALKLFLSHRTVGSHLYRIFPKLGITARSQLRDLFDGGP
jgi:DNA-binding CsgD family transcriptional regulator